MSKEEESFHLMAVPRSFTPHVLKAGGRFMKLKERQWVQADTLSLISQIDSPDGLVHILAPGTHRSYELLGEEFIEDMSICKTTFEQGRDRGYEIRGGLADEVNCPECRKSMTRE